MSLARHLRITLGKLLRFKEDAYPKDAHGRPDLGYYTDPLDYYVAMHRQSMADLQGPRRRGGMPDLAFKRRVHATWGLIAKGEEAIPYATSLLQHAEPEAREDGAAILAAVRREAG